MRRTPNRFGCSKQRGRMRPRPAECRVALTGGGPDVYCRVSKKRTGASAKGGDSENAGRAGQGRRVLRERHEALQEAVREGWHPERDQEARALREAVCQAQEEGAGGEEARAEEGAKGDDVTFRSASPPFVPGPARVRGGAFDRERNARRPD